MRAKAARYASVARPMPNRNGNPLPWPLARCGLKLGAGAADGVAPAVNVVTTRVGCDRGSKDAFDLDHLCGCAEIGEARTDTREHGRAASSRLHFGWPDDLHVGEVCLKLSKEVVLGGSAVDLQ